MKSVCYAALPVLLMCAGCFPSTFGFHEPPPPPAPVATPSKPAVTPESVNANNAYEKFSDLNEEVDRAESKGK